MPVIIGTNLDEARYWLYYLPELDRLPLRYYRPWLESLVGRRADDVVAASRAERPDLDAAQTGMALAGDVGFRMPASRMAEALTERGVPVWMYLTTLQSPDLNGRMGAAHASGTAPWPRFDPGSRSTLIVNRDLAVQDDPYPASRTAWGDMALDGSDPTLDRLTPLQYAGTNPNDPLVIAAVIGWGWVLLAFALLIALVAGVVVIVRHVVSRRRGRRAAGVGSGR